VGGDPNTEYLTYGIPESLINRLSQLPHLRVVPRSIAFRYQEKDVDAQKAGHDLSVRSILTGRIIQRGDTLNIQTELMDVEKISVLWGDQYNRKLSDILAVQEEIATVISDRLRLRLTGEEQNILTRRYTENTEAYQLYMKGRYYVSRRTGEGLNKAVECFEQAIEKDPEYALAYAGLADCHALASWFNNIPAKDSFPRAREAATKALELDSTIAEAHATLAFCQAHYDRDWTSAERGFKRSIELNPRYALAHHYYAYSLAQIGRLEESIGEIQEAQALEPLDLPI